MPRIRITGIPEYKKGGWIQSATKSIEKRGTKGVCTGAKFGSSSCPAGSKRYALAKTFRAMAKKRKHEEGGIQYPGGGIIVGGTRDNSIPAGNNAGTFDDPTQFKNHNQFINYYKKLGYQSMDSSGFPNRMYNPANYNYVNYEPKQFVQPTPGRQPLNFNTNLGVYDPNTSTYRKNIGSPIVSTVNMRAGGILKYDTEYPSQMLPNIKPYKMGGDVPCYECGGTFKNGGTSMYTKGGYYEDGDVVDDEPTWSKGIRAGIQAGVDSGYITKADPDDIVGTKQVGQPDNISTSNRRPMYDIGNRRTPYNQGSNNWKNAAYYGAGTLAQSAGQLAYLAEQGKKYDTQRFYGYTPRYLDPTAALRDADLQANAARYDLANATGGNQGTYLANRANVMGTNTLNKAAIRQHFENANAGIGNQAGMYNLQNRYMVDDINARRKGQALGNYYNTLGSLGTNVASGMRDYRADQYDQERMGYLPYMYNNPEFNRVYGHTQYGYRLNS